MDDIRGLAAPHFSRLNPEARDEALQNTLGLCWLFWLRLVKQGKAGDEAVFRSMVWYAVKHTKMGRLPQGGGSRKAKCVLNYAQRRMRGVNIEPMDLNYFVGQSASVPDQAVFRIDTPAFLGTLSEKNRALALDLAQGMTTTEAAQRHEVTPGAISQFRTRFRKWWTEFHGEAA